MKKAAANASHQTYSDNKDIDDIDDDDEEEGPKLVPFVIPKEKPAPEDKKR
jgi:hypothetical protein